MRAIILAAGRGSRMRGLTEARPKCLVEFRGVPLLEHQINALRSAGVREVAIVTGYRRELLEPWGLREFHNANWAETNSLSSLACASEWLLDGPCLVSYSDIFYAPDAVRSLVACRAHLALTYDRNWLALWSARFDDPLVDAETFRLQPDGTLAEIGRKPKSISEVEGQYMGLLRIAPVGWREIERIRAGLLEQDRCRIDMTTMLQKVLDDGRVSITAVPYDLEWGEIDSESDLAILEHRSASTSSRLLHSRQRSTAS